MISWSTIIGRIWDTLEEQKEKGNIQDFHVGERTFTVWGTTQFGTAKTFLIEVREV